MIHPLHQKGSVNNPDNDRGISLLNICSKLYSSIINKRLSRWVEEKDILGDIQAGFRKENSTIDHNYIHTFCYDSEIFIETRSCMLPLSISVKLSISYPTASVGQFCTKLVSKANAQNNPEYV